MKRTLTALTVAASLIASGASAFDPDDLQKLKDTGDCVACDLEGAFLSGADLSGANLMSADLSGAYLSGAELSGADLSGALLKEADRFGANLEDAIMRGAILCKTLMPDYSMNDSGC